MRIGFTLIEVLCVVAITALLTAIALPRITTLMDGAAVRSAALEVDALLSAARQASRARGRTATVEIDTTRRQITIRIGADTIRLRPLGTVYGVRIHASRAVIAYASDGLGFGAANTTVVVERGAAADTVTVSRLGRVRR